MNVYEAAQQRIAYLFGEFEQVVVSFSGGKDSGVLLNLVLDYAREHGQLSRLSVYHMDYEAQYQCTTDYVTRTFDHLPREVTPYWVCLPIKAQCSTSMFQSYWQPWKESDRAIWCRQMPMGTVNEQTFDMGFDYEVSDYEFNNRFARWMSRKKTTCFLVGIRTQESLHRWKAVNKATDKNEYKGNKYTTRQSDRLTTAYPIYDWTVEDVWTANARNGYDYNKVYDLMYLAGVPLNKMRVASPFNDCAQESLKLYKVLEPNTWGLMIGRVNGVNFTGLYGGTTAMGWHTITKPKHFTWKQYMEFLLDTLPEETRQLYIRKLEVSKKYWLTTGGALPSDMIDCIPEGIEYENLGAPTNNRNYSKDYTVVRFKHYLDEIDIKNPNLLPTYKRMCIAIMKNDTSCKTLGFGLTKDELIRRKEIQKKYKDL